MSGGKGGSQTSQVTIPAYIEEASKANLARANEIAQLGYTPYFGPDVAAFSPMQQAAFANTGQAAQAFGLSGGGMTGMEGMPQARYMAGGGYGYSSAPITEAALGQLQQRAPAQYDFIRGMFIDPVTGQRPNVPFSQGGTIYEALPEEDRMPMDTPFVVPRSGGAPGSKGGDRDLSVIASQGAGQTQQGTGQPAQGPSPEQQAAAQAAYNKRIGLTPQMAARGLTVADVMGR